MWPVRSLANIVSFRLVFWFDEGQCWTFGLIGCRKGCGFTSQSSCTDCKCFSCIRLRKSLSGIGMLFLSGFCRLSLAASSAFSFPWIPACPGIHSILIVLPMFVICCILFIWCPVGCALLCLCVSALCCRLGVCAYNSLLKCFVYEI